MTKDEVIEMMQRHGFSEHVEEIWERGGIKYAVSWTRVSDQFKGPTVIDTSATQAFIKSAHQTLGQIAFNDLKASELP
ncbi:MAG: hypothetical protein KGI25_08115 [Thaumarchaeota archaeon]|nr:hypothetical protein [Nitrososphaerota archaeon]